MWKKNNSTQNHWEKDKCPQKGKGKLTPKVSSSSGNKKKLDKKGKGKEKAKDSLNVLSIIELPKVNTMSSQSIDFSCYEKGDIVEWLLDGSCTEHVTPVRSDLHNYREFNPHRKAEVVDGKFITIHGYGTVAGFSLLPDGTKYSMDIRKVLYVPEASKQLFSLIAVGHMNNKSEITRWGTMISQNRIPFIIGKLHGNKLHYFDLELATSNRLMMNTARTTVSCDYTLWHIRMGHTNQRGIHNLPHNTEDGPDNVTVAPTNVCEGGKKGKSKLLPFPSSKSRATEPLGLVHSNLDFQFAPSAVINGPQHTLMITIIWSYVLLKEQR